MQHGCSPDLTCGTSLERIAAESLTRPFSDFVHGQIWRLEAVAPLPSGIEGFLPIDSSRTIDAAGQSQIPGRVNTAARWRIGIHPNCRRMNCRARPGEPGPVRSSVAPPACPVHAIVAAFADQPWLRPIPRTHPHPVACRLAAPKEAGSERPGVGRGRKWPRNLCAVDELGRLQHRGSD